MLDDISRSRITKKNNGYVKKNDQILLRWLQLLESCWLLKHNFKLGDILVFYAMFMQDFRVWPFFYHAIMEESFLNYTNNYFKRSSYYLWMKFYSSRKRHLILTFAGYHGPFQYEMPIPVRYSETLFSTFFCSS